MSYSVKNVARVVPELHLDKAFDYAVPAPFQSTIALGSKVRIPFGSREINGYVVDLLPESTFAQLKPILDLVGPQPLIPSTLIQLAQWMSEYYGAPLALALKNILPESLRRADASFKQRLWVEPRSGMNPHEVARSLSKSRSQRLAWDFLIAEGSMWLAEACARTRTTHAVWRALADKGFVTIQSATQERDPFSADTPLPSEALPLTLEQGLALAAYREERQSSKPRVILLHGVTGSGKTEVYLQAIHETLQQGKTALVLVPEIALTPQTIDRFRSRFLGQKIRVAVLHSHLSPGERHDQWHQIHSGKARIIIGARSAVFAPTAELGLIVVDEEHETSYKQEEMPTYHARDVAIMRGHFEKIPVLLGSATPSLESYAHALEGKYRLCSLTTRAENQAMPTMHVLDLRQEFKKQKKPTLFSSRLIEAVEQRLARQEQTILFLNRRGYSTSLQCPQCGHVEMCPHCSVPLTYHRAAQKLQCHFCDYQAAVPTHCPSCQFDRYKYSGVGTEKIEELTQTTFPQARIVRMDSDTMRGKGAHAKTLRQFAEGNIDILVGTQMIAKGLHFPKVTCVGVIHADLALQLPDFRASERVFQILMQVAGRAGRGDRVGEVFVQTNTPFHPAIQFARHHDYLGFAEQELEFRQQLRYPPYSRLILLTWRGRDDGKTAYLAQHGAAEIRKKLSHESLDIPEPSPAPLAKLNNYYRYHLLLKVDKIPPHHAPTPPMVTANHMA